MNNALKKIYTDSFGENVTRVDIPKDKNDFATVNVTLDGDFYIELNAKDMINLLQGYCNKSEKLTIQIFKRKILSDKTLILTNFINRIAFAIEDDLDDINDIERIIKDIIIKSNHFLMDYINNGFEVAYCE